MLFVEVFMLPTSALLCLALLLQPAPNVVEEPVRIDYVLLDVIAHDRQGRPVDDLTLADFVLKENRRKVTLQSLDLLDLASLTEAGASVEPGKPARTVATRVVLALDLEPLGIGARNRALRELDRQLERWSPRDDLTLLLRLLDHGDLTDGFVSPTRARGALTRHLARNEPTTATAGLAGAPELDDLRDLEQRFERCSLGGSSVDPLSGRQRTGREGAHACILDELEAFVAAQARRTLGTLDELEQLAYRVGEGSSPTAILFVSPGFSLEPGSSAIRLAARYDRVRDPQDRDLQSGATSPRSPTLTSTEQLQPYPDPPSFEREFRRVIHACVSRRVAFHTFDLFSHGAVQDRDLDTSMRTASGRLLSAYETYREETTRGLVALATASGGFRFSGATLDPMDDVIRQTRRIYVLGYRSPAGTPGKYRRIQLKCKRKGVELRHRTGYFGG